MPLLCILSSTFLHRSASCHFTTESQWFKEMWIQVEKRFGYVYFCHFFFFFFSSQVYHEIKQSREKILTKTNKQTLVIFPLIWHQQKVMLMSWLTCENSTTLHHNSQRCVYVYIVSDNQWNGLKRMEVAWNHTDQISQDHEWKLATEGRAASRC